jgi:hypothetical protein
MVVAINNDWTNLSSHLKQEDDQCAIISLMQAYNQSLTFIKSSSNRSCIYAFNSYLRLKIH